MSSLRGVTLAELAKKYRKNGGMRKANFAVSSQPLINISFPEIVGEPGRGDGRRKMLFLSG
jgi:hypothetical protein